MHLRSRRRIWLALLHSQPPVERMLTGMAAASHCVDAAVTVDRRRLIGERTGVRGITRCASMPEAIWAQCQRTDCVLRKFGAAAYIHDSRHQWRTLGAKSLPHPVATGV